MQSKRKWPNRYWLRLGMSVLLVVLTAYLLATALAPRPRQAVTPEPPMQAEQSVAGANTPTTSQTAATAPTRKVSVVTAQEGTLTATRVTAVTIEPAQESSVAAGTSGRVRSVLKRKDEAVAAGEVVVELDTERLQLQAQDAELAVQSASVALQKAQQANVEDQGQASDRLRSAETLLRPLEQKVNEARELYAAGVISRSELETLEAEYAQAQSDYNAARDDVARSQRAEGEDLEMLRLQLDQAQTQLELTRQALAQSSIRSPFEGDITELLVSPGEFVNDGDPAFTVASTKEQVARFNVPPEIANRLLAQGLIYIKYAGADYAAQVTTVGSVDVTSQLAEVTARIYDSATRMQNGVVTQLPYEEEISNGILLPANAVQREGSTTFVFVLEDGQAIRRTITIVGEASGQVATTGIDGGVVVIYPVPEGLRDGSKVEAQN